MGMLKLEVTGDGCAGQPGEHEDQKGGPRGRSQASFPSNIFKWLYAQMGQKGLLNNIISSYKFAWIRMQVCKLHFTADTNSGSNNFVKKSK
jgi:hypothetical protein